MNTNELHSRERHCRKIIWRFGQRDAEFDVYGFNVVTYGDRPAATILEVVKRIMIELGKQIDVDTAERISFCFI